MQSTKPSYFPTGLSVQLLLLVSWIAGFVLPAAVPVLFLLGRPAVATALLGAVVALYVGPVANGERLKAWLNRSIGGAFREESMRLEEPLRHDGPFLLAYHPHGMFAWGYFAHGGMHTAINPMGKPASVVGLITSSLVRQPLFRFVFTRTLGVLESASKASVVGIMRARRNFGILPGGFHEATICEHGKDRVYIKKRFGFIKYALQFGYAVYPVYTFGEADTYRQPGGGYGWRLALNDRDLPAILPFGKWWCPLLPQWDVGLHTVVGKRLVLPQIESPTTEDVAKWHAAYVAALKELFDRNKASLSARGAAAELDIW